jgi:hypothetical protein
LDHSELLSAAVPGAICPVLVLPPAAHEAK